MRSNGLTAPAYTPVADLDPVLATALLSDLRDQGVAAYTKPVESSSATGFDRPEFRSNVRDRLYVDAAASALVRDLLSERDPHLLDVNDDLTWAQLVAGFDQPVAEGVAPWPIQEDFGPADSAESASSPGASGPAGTDILPFTDRRNRAGGLGPRDETGDQSAARSDRQHDDPAQPHRESFDDADFLASTSKTAARDEDSFVPEPPPPLPRLAPHRQVAWLGVVAGPLLLLLVTLFGISLPNWVSFLGVLGFIGGFIALVATMTDRDDEWGSDDGAVV